MKTMKNKTLLSLMLVFAVAFSAFAFSLSDKNAQKVLAASPFEGDEVAFSTTSARYDVTPDTYDFFTFEYKFDTNDSSNELSVYLMDGNSSKYYGYYYFKQDGTFYHPKGRSAGISTNVVDGWVRVLFTVADLQDRNGDASGANKPADLKRFYVKATSGTGLVRNARFYFARTTFDGSAVVRIEAENGGAYDFVSFEYKFDNASESNNLHFALTNNGDKLLYGAFDLTDNGTTDKGVTTKVLEDGYVKATIEVAKAKKYQDARDDWDIKKIYIYKTSDGTSGSGIVRNEEFYYAPPETIEMVEGASVRLSEPYGIRFRANLSESIATNDDASFGMTIIPYDWVVNFSDNFEAAGGDYIAALDAVGVTYRKFDCTPVQDGDDYYIQASLTNIKEANLTREFIGIAWFEKSGKKTYAFNENCARSIRTVATKALIAENDALNANEEHTYEETYAAGERDYLFSQTTHYSLTDKATVKLPDKAVKDKSVIEFYYRKKTAGKIRFAVIGEDWKNYYGYFEFENNISFKKGVQIMPMGESWQYNGTNTDALADADHLWYRVVIDPAVLQDAYGDPSAQTWFDTLKFNDCTATFDIIGVTVRERTVEDGAYFIMGKNQVDVRKYYEPSIDLSGKSELSFYIKEVSAKGKKGANSYVKLRIDFDSGSNTGYVEYNSSSSGAVAVTQGEYAGWYKITISLDPYSSPKAISVINSRYTQGEYFVGGFSAS